MNSIRRRTFEDFRDGTGRAYGERTAGSTKGDVLIGGDKRLWHSLGRGRTPDTFRHGAGRGGQGIGFTTASAPVPAPEPMLAPVPETRESKATANQTSNTAFGLRESSKASASAPGPRLSASDEFRHGTGRSGVGQERRSRQLASKTNAWLSAADEFRHGTGGQGLGFACCINGAAPMIRAAARVPDLTPTEAEAEPKPEPEPESTEPQVSGTNVCE